MTTYLDDQAQSWATHYGWAASHNIESRSGPGSTLDATINVRAWLPDIIKKHGITSMLDAPCGDMLWMGRIDLTGVDYTGWDVEPDIIAANRENYPQHSFYTVNLLTVEILPTVDLIVCRDFMVHLPDPWITVVLDKMRASGSRWLAATTFPDAVNGYPADDIHDTLRSHARAVNLQAAPFSLPGRVDAVTENGWPRELALFDLHKRRPGRPRKQQ